MRTKDYFFELPEELIAQYPSDRRGESRMLVLDRAQESCIDSTIDHLADYLPPETLLVVNNSKVRKARVYGRTESGGMVEFLFIRQLDLLRWEVMVTKAKRQKIGRVYSFDALYSATMSEVLETTRVIETNAPIDEDFFEKNGHVPLPPYIKREDEFSDATRYQTVYAEHAGSVAAPTAGLHLTKELIQKLEQRGIRFAPVTLHVGLGTFLPVRSEHIEEHSMHSEQYEISTESAELINSQLSCGKPIIAVGTTSVRTLESAFDQKSRRLRSGRDETDIFIHPGYEFNVISGLLTNFHTPESTLLMLVSALAGRQRILSAYEHAVNQRYRFFSYGDAMLIL